MALIKCKDCGKEVSTDTSNCQNCGAKTQQTSILPKILVGVFLVACFMVLGLKNHGSPEERDAKFKQANAECSMVGAKIAIPNNGTVGNGDKAITAIEDCMASRGFRVKLRD